MYCIAFGKTVAWGTPRFSQPRFTHCDANGEEVDNGPKYAASVNVVTKTKGNVFGLAGGRLDTPPKYI